MTNRTDQLTQAFKIKSDAAAAHTLSTEAKANAAAMSADMVASAYRGTNVTMDDAVKEIGTAWKNVYAKDISKPVLSDYKTFVQCGQDQTYFLATTAWDQWKAFCDSERNVDKIAAGQRYQTIRDLLRRNHQANASLHLPYTAQGIADLKASKDLNPKSLVKRLENTLELMNEAIGATDVVFDGTAMITAFKEHLPEAFRPKTKTKKGQIKVVVDNTKTQTPSAPLPTPAPTPTVENVSTPTFDLDALLAQAEKSADPRAKKLAAILSGKKK